MKILHVIDSGGFYGAEAMLVELALEQQNAGINVMVCSIGTPNDTVKPIESVCNKKGIPVFPLRMKAGLNLLGGLEIVRYAKQNKYELFHSHGYKGNILLGILPRFIREIPLITTVHGWTSSGKFTKMKAYEWLDSLFLSRMDAVVLVSHAMLQRKELKGRRFNRLQVIPNGISDTLPVTKKNNTVLQRIETLAKDGAVVGSVGRLSYEKGFDVLLSSFAKILFNIPNCNLVIIGEGKLKKELEKQSVELGISDRVYFFGYVENAGSYISTFDIYVNSSRTEGTPITLLETMRCKVPIIASQVGGNYSLLQKGRLGELFESGNVKQLSMKIENILLKKNETKVNLAFDTFQKQHTSKIMALSYFQEYEKLISKS